MTPAQHGARTMSGPDIFISAGEASGEHYGALLIAELKRRLAAQNRSANFFGMGGPRMAAAGLETVVRAEDMAVMGITEVVRHLPRIYREFRHLKSAIRTRRPGVAILIDFPDIHFKLAEQLHRQGVPVIFFVSPQLWAWKKHRIRLVQNYVDKMLVIFPFEEEFYRDHGVNAEFVGHPLADLPLPAQSRNRFALSSGLDPGATWIALLPGSRTKEIRDNLPEMLSAARLLVKTMTSEEAVTESTANPKGNLVRETFQFIVPLAPTLSSAQRQFIIRLLTRHSSGLSVQLADDARITLFHARASIVASGTATVEAALMGNPFVVVYRVSPVTFAIAKRVVTVPHVAMANLIAGSRAVPELIQNNFTASNIVQHIAPLLPDGAPRQSMMQELKRIRSLLGPRTNSTEGTHSDAIERVATIVLDRLGLASPVSAPVQS
ncbi:MAG TPA: lipid-A-disaccharide synthase [Terracidiphilus sp.]|nr:lipid-A-disaccharide synthase [Terracidiphilus sp.]